MQLNPFIHVPGETTLTERRPRRTRLLLLLALGLFGLCSGASAAYAAGGLVSWGDDSGGKVSGTPAGNNFIAVSAGLIHSAALRSDGSLISWGNDPRGQVSGTPAGNDFAAVTTGGYHSVALRSDGSLVSWGDNSLGQVGGTPPGNAFVAVSAGYYFSVALRSDGSLASWGYNPYGLAPAGNDFVAASAGGFHGVALLSDGSLVSWGWNANGQVSGTPAGNDFIAASAGYSWSVALRSDGSLVSWGYDFNGQVSGTPAGNDFIAVSAGGIHNVALRSDGTLVSWGGDSYGQVGGTPPGRYSAISAGGYHSVALLANTAPVVDAGGDQAITLPAEAELDGTVTDDGLPSPPALATLWSVGSGPGPVEFLDAATVDTRASFASAGTYVLRLTASDGELNTTDSVTIQVAPAPTPAQQIAAIGDDVQELVTSGALTASQAGALTTKLDAALGLVERGNTQGGIGKLSDFVKQVSSYIKSGKLTAAEGQPLIDAAQALIAELQASSQSTTPVAVSAPTGRDMAPARALTPGASSPAAGGDAVAEFRLYPGSSDRAGGTITLRFDLPRASNVLLELYDIAGRRIDELQLGSMGPGRMKWTSARLELPSAMLFYRLKAGDLVATGKLPFVR